MLGLLSYRRYNVKVVIEVLNLTSTENDCTISQDITTRDERESVPAVQLTSRVPGVLALVFLCYVDGVIFQLTY